VISAVIEVFFYLSSRSQPDGFPLFVAAFPPVLLGVVLLVRFART
jgi:hypothetical protein